MGLRLGNNSGQLEIARPGVDGIAAHRDEGLYLTGERSNGPAIRRIVGVSSMVGEEAGLFGPYAVFVPALEPLITGGTFITGPSGLTVTCGHALLFDAVSV